MTRSTGAAILVTLLLSACGGSETPEAPRNTTPEAAFAAAQKGLAAGDWNALIDLMPPSRLAQQKDVFERTKADKDAGMMAMQLEVKPEELKAMSFREFGRRLLTKALAEEPEYVAGFVDAKVENVKIDGDSATITTTVAGRKVEIPLAKEDGLWYVSRLIN